MGNHQSKGRFLTGLPRFTSFAAIVLHGILSTIQPELEQRAAHQAYNKTRGMINMDHLGLSSVM
jgi:hypothetical protein